MDVRCTPGAGLDVHQQTVMACGVPPDPPGAHADGVMERKAGGALTVALLALSDGLAAAGMTPVAIESTGEAWKPLENLLEGDVTVFRVNAAPGKPVPGRQTEKADARWLATRMRSGWLRARCLPPVAQRDWRELTRDRTTVGQEHRREGQRVQGVLERATLKRAAGATARMGGSARAILAALVAGQADPATLAELATRRRRRKMPLLEQALTELLRDHHRPLLARPLAHLACLDEPIAALRAEMTRRLAALRSAASSAESPGRVGEARSAATLAAGETAMTFARALTRLDTMPGVNPRGGELLVAEWGLAMGRCGTAAR